MGSFWISRFPPRTMSTYLFLLAYLYYHLADIIIVHYLDSNCQEIISHYLYIHLSILELFLFWSDDFGIIFFQILPFFQ